MSHLSFDGSYSSANSAGHVKSRRQIGVIPTAVWLAAIELVQRNIYWLPRSDCRSLLQTTGGVSMEELNGRMIACQILITGLIAHVANTSKDPLRFLTDFRDEIKAVVSQVRIAGVEDPQKIRQTAQATVDELLSLMKPPSSDSPA